MLSDTARSSQPAPSLGPKRVRALLRHGDLRGRDWRAASKLGQLGWLGQIVARANLPASCNGGGKNKLPTAKCGGASAFTRGSELVGYEHGVYAKAEQSRRTLGDAVSSRSIGCLARLLTSAQFHTHATFARYSLTGFQGVSLWRVVVRTRSGNRITRTDYLDVAGLQRGRANALMMFAETGRP
jgi:hypothetical protein